MDRELSLKPEGEMHLLEGSCRLVLFWVVTVSS